MNPKDLVKQFKAAPWRGQDEVQAFISQLDSQPDPHTLVQLLEILCSKRFAGDAGAHSMRVAAFSKLAASCENKRLFPEYVKAIKNGDTRVRQLIVSLLPKVNDPADHQRLCSLLKLQAPEVRSATIEALKKVAGKTTIQLLGKMISEKDFAGRSETIDLIMPMAGHHAAVILKSVLEVGTQPEKLKALKYLGDVRFMGKAPSAALRSIVPGLEDKDDKVVAQAITSFCALAGEDAYFEYIEPYLESDNINLVKIAVSGLARFCSPRVILALERKFLSGPSIIRSEVLNVLEKIGNDEVLPPLVEALGYKEVAIRNRAGEVLGKLSQAGKLDVARVVIWLLHSRKVEVRRMAVEIAQKVKDPSGELWPKLLQFLRDEDWWVRERVMDALVEMAGKQLTPHMVGLLKDPYDVVRRFAVDVLAKLGDVQALGALVNTAREDTDWWAREKAIEAMGTLGDERAVPYIVDLMRRSEEMQYVSITTLHALNAASSAPYVAELLASSDADVRLAALNCLEAFKAMDFASRLQPMLADPNPRVAIKAKEILLHWNVELSKEHSETRDKAVSFLDKMLAAAVDAKADDLIIASGRKPYMKRRGKMVPISNTVLTPEQVGAIITPHLSVAQVEDLNKLTDIDFSYEIEGDGLRFRANVFQQYGGLGAVFRSINSTTPDLEALGLPEIIKTFGDMSYGLILVGGPTGSGKSTTLAALIDYINRTSDRHVISLEDPIEVVHESKKGLINQREIGSHTKTFGAALRSTLRQDPDVILVGEMRDLDTISFAVTAAETGHLVFGTLHTVSAHTSVDRLINAFPPKEQPQVRATLAENLRAVVCQYLIEKADGEGRALAAEIMINSDAIANMIRKGKTFQIPSIVTTSGEMGMQLMDTELMRLFKQGIITAEDAYMKANVKKDFESLVSSETKDKALGTVTYNEDDDSTAGGGLSSMGPASN